MPWLLLLSLLACGGATPDPVAERPAAVVTDADYTNAKGELVCPVMGDAIASKEAAVASAEFEGKTYWFCCDSCQHRFADAPDVYAEGRFLAHLDAEHDGKSWTCTHY